MQDILPGYLCSFLQDLFIGIIKSTYYSEDQKYHKKKTFCIKKPVQKQARRRYSMLFVNVPLRTTVDEPKSDSVPENVPAACPPEPSHWVTVTEKL